MKKKRKTTSKRKIKPYRIDKRIPKRTTASITQDRGHFKEIIEVSFPEKAEVERRFIPKEKNPNLITIKFDNCKLCWYLNEERGFVYTCDGKYLGNIYKHDLKKLFSEIGHLLNLVKG